MVIHKSKSGVWSGFRGSAVVSDRGFRRSGIEILEPRDLLSVWTTKLDYPVHDVAIETSYYSAPGQPTVGPIEAYPYDPREQPVHGGPIDAQPYIPAPTENLLREPLRVGVHTSGPISNLQSWIRAQVWPSWLHAEALDARHVEQLVTYQLRGAGTQGGWRTVLRFNLDDAILTRPVSVDEAIADMRNLDFVEYARLNRLCAVQYSPRSQELVDALTTTGSKSPVYIASAMPAGMIEVRIGIRTPERIADLGSYIESQQWPAELGAITRNDVTQLASIPLLSDPGGGVRTIATLRIRGNIDALENLPFIEFARLEAESAVHYGPGIQELIDSLTTTGSDAPVYLAQSDPAPAPLNSGPAEAVVHPMLVEASDIINLGDYRSDPRFQGMDGSGYAVAVLDTGIDAAHPFFGPGQVVHQWDYVDNNAAADDLHGHGTHVSSVIASRDGTYTGVAPGADLVSLKVLDGLGNGDWGMVEDALGWIIANGDLYNIAAVNMSLGDLGNYQQASSLYGIGDELAALANSNVFVVAASGNQYQGVQGVAYPAADPNVISVGAVYDADIGSWSYPGGQIAYSTAADRIAPFSQRHETLTTVMAPGAAITAAWPGGGTNALHGTSQAAPFVTGAAILAKQVAASVSGGWLPMSQQEFAGLMRYTSDAVVDGDDEVDNVAHTQLEFRRLDVHALAEAAYNRVWIVYASDSPGGQRDDGIADTFVVSSSGDSINVVVNGYTLTRDANILAAVEIRGSTDDDSMTVNPLASPFARRPGIVPRVTLVPWGDSSTGDIGVIYDSVGNDFLYANYLDSYLETGTGYDVFCTSAGTITVRATQGGVDQAYFYDSPLADKLVNKDDYTRLITNYADGTGRGTWAWYFDVVTARADSFTGDADVAELRGSTYADTFSTSEAEPDVGTLTLPGYSITASKFPTLSVLAGGGIDTAFLYDTASNDTFYGYPDHSQLVGGGLDYTVNGFEQASAYSKNCGVDAAWLYDSSYNDRLVVREDYTRFYYNYQNRSDYIVHAKFFDHVFSQADNFLGDSDLADMYGTPANDLLEVGVEYAKLYFRSAVGQYSRAKYFAQVNAYHGGGTDDRADVDTVPACLWLEAGWRLI